MLAQATKTIDRPSRLFFGPVTRLLLRFPRLLPFVLPMLPEGWIAQVGGKAFCLEIGYKFFQQDRPVQAWPWLKRSLHMGSPSIDDNLLAAMCLYHGLGRFHDAISFLALANEQSLKEAESRGLVNFPFRALDSVWARHIGHTATLDYVIKLGILEGRAQEDTVLYLPPGSPIANRFLLQQMSTHLRLVENPADLPFDASAVQAVHYDYLAPRLPDGRTVYFWEIGGQTHKRWQDEGRGPLLTLPPEVEARGWAALRRAGVPRGAWFVALHVREGKWDGRNAGLHGIMNANISTYMPAIAEITRRGGWVVRMGDPGMKPLNPLANVIDYCHSDLRADWMDVFVAACCRFLIGSTSGPAFIPPLYGVPVVLTNWWPPAQRPWHASDIFIPKMTRRLADGRYLTLSESLCEPFAWCHSRRYLASRGGVQVDDNHPDIILGAVVEMLARLDGDLCEDASVVELRLRAEEVYQSHRIAGTSQLAGDFLQRHSEFMA
jgi:putative glycosyltransferase (TIGR04372 family)